MKTAIEAWVNNLNSTVASDLLSACESDSALAQTYVAYSGSTTLDTQGSYVLRPRGKSFGVPNLSLNTTELAQNVMDAAKQLHFDAQSLSLRSAQPNLDSAVFLAALLRLVGSDWRAPSESIHKRRFYASHLQLVGHYFGTVFGQCHILFGPASAVGETE